MKQHLLLLFLLAATTAFAQTKKFSVGVSGAPLWSDDLKTNKSVLRDNPKSSLGFQAGLFGEYAFSTTFSLRLGVGYLQTREEIPKRKLTWPQPEPSAPDYLAGETIIPFVSVPVLLKFQLGKNKKWYGIVGSNLWIPLGRGLKLTYWYPDGTVTTIQSTLDANPFLSSPLNGLIGLGYEFHLAPKIHFFVEPTATLLLTNLYGDKFAHRPYTAGLNTGIRF